jgi:hypothetical protein
MFTAPAELSGRNQVDITGLMGQYAHGNEPSHHMAYLYNYIGKPYKTQKLVREIMNDLYTPRPDGLCGNEDCGQMSAWFVFSALGFYPVTPALDYYTLGSPLFKKIVVHLDEKKKFVITAENNNTSNIYIQNAVLNGESYNQSFLEHKNIIKGGKLHLELGSLPDPSYAVAEEERPVSAISDHLITPAPYFIASSGIFKDDLSIKINHINAGAQVYYNYEGLSENAVFRVYTEPIMTDKTLSLSAYAVLSPFDPSKTATASFHKIHHEWNVSIKNPYSSQYTAGGDLALVDGQKGGMNVRTGSWQGYQGVDFEMVIDLGNVLNINRISATFLQDQRSWIFMPVKIEFAISRSAFDYRTVAIYGNEVPQDLPEPVIREFNKDRMRERGRYIRIRAKNTGTCPDWHPGAGHKAWIFIDEVTVE